MAFNGSLSEFGVVALLQLPGTNHLSGKLILEQADETAEFYYSKGNLIHAVLGKTTGREALVEVIDWMDGDFVFDSSSKTDQNTIKQDLQNTLMWALKERDEKKKLKEEEEQAARERELVAKKIKEEEERVAREKELAARKLKEEEERVAREKELAAKKLKEEEERAAEKAAAALAVPKPVVLPQSIMTNSSIIEIAYLFNSKGQIIAVSQAEVEYLEKVAPILKAIQSLVRDYPERAVGKIFIEDPEFTLAISGLSDTQAAVIFVPLTTRMGVLNIELGKFLRALQSSGLEILDE